jgi:hypothetical protein
VTRAPALALLALVLALASPARAKDAPEAIVLVLDRSASLRHADPTARGPRVLAMALALSLREGQRVSLLTTDGAAVGPFAMDGVDAPALLRRLDEALSAAPQQVGGADLAAALSRAYELAGTRGLVVVFTDDDLDVIGPDGRPPAAALERASRSLGASSRPARDDVNRAAADLLVEGLPAPGARPTLVGLRAPLPARSAPVLERAGADLVELRKETPDPDVVVRLAAAIAGDPLLLRGDPLDAPVTLPWPARVGILSPTPVEVAGGAKLDGGGRLWLLDATAGAPLPVVPGATAVVLPRVEVPADVHAWALESGVVRVAAVERQAAPGCGLSARAGDSETSLAAAGPSAPGVLHGDLWPGADVAQVEVQRVVAGGGGRAITARRLVAVERVEVVLAPAGPVQAGSAVELRGALPPGLVPRRAMSLRVSQAGGSQVVPLEARDGALVARIVPQRPGALQVEAEGELRVRLGAPIDVGPEVERHLVIERLTASWTERAMGELAAGESLDVSRGPARLELQLRLEPPAGSPLPITAALEGAPAGSELVFAPGATIVDQAALSFEVRWPKELGSGAVTLRLRAGEGDRLSVGRALSIDTGPSWARRGIAAGIILVSVVWFVFLVQRRRRLLALATASMGEKQIRAVGPNGRLTFERYKLLDGSQEDLSALINPEESQASIRISVRDDGTVHAVALEGAQIVHEDQPTVMAKDVVLSHGNAFAVVHDKRARRYVYLDREPSAEDLAARYVDAVSVGEGEVRDSGVFVILDDDQNMASTDAISARASGLFPIKKEAPAPAAGDQSSADDSSADDVADAEDAIETEGFDDDSDVGSDDLFEDSSDEVIKIPEMRATSGRLVSDEGIVIVDSDEASIIDTIDPDEETHPGTPK